MYHLLNNTWNKSSTLKNSFCIMTFLVRAKKNECNVCDGVDTFERRCVVIVIDGSHHVFPKVGIHLIPSLSKRGRNAVRPVSAFPVLDYLQSTQCFSIRHLMYHVHNFPTQQNPGKVEVIVIEVVFCCSIKHMLL